MPSKKNRGIGVARALALNPRFIVADEPVSALDMSVRSEILNLMLDLKEDLQLTYLLIAHERHAHGDVSWKDL